MSILKSLLECVEELERVGGHPEVIRSAKDAVKAFRAATSRGGRHHKGRPPNPLPWEDILAERKRGRTWAEIRNRLEAAGYRITRRHLRTRYVRYLNEQPAA